MIMKSRHEKTIQKIFPSDPEVATSGASQRMASTDWQSENLEERVFILFYSSRVESIMVRKSGWQEVEAAAHVIATIRKQRAMNVTGGFSPTCQFLKIHSEV